MNRSLQARKARQRAALILKVRSGQLTATAAARRLGISRQAYYQWEQRALRAMLRALEELPRGRPRRQRDPQGEALLQQNQQLQKQLRLYEQKDRLRALLKPWPEPRLQGRGSGLKKKP